MSRAFVTEADSEDSAERLPELPQSPHPNYVTRRGRALLDERFAEAQARQRALLAAPDDPANQLHLAHVAREIRYLEGRIDRAILVDRPAGQRDEVAFGAVVDVVDAEGRRRAFAIVGEDEANAEQGLVSWVSPLARALMGARAGDVVLWRRPAGEIELEIEAVHYPEG
jgi:transcription elongation GreA/GreB family factor